MVTVTVKNGNVERDYEDTQKETTKRGITQRTQTKTIF